MGRLLDLLSAESPFRADAQQTARSPLARTKDCCVA
jgi:hypothetical protein